MSEKEEVNEKEKTPEKAEANLVTLEYRVHQDPERIRSMFDRISGAYDFLNSFLTLGIDQYWRRRAVGALEHRAEMKYLDLCCGTGDMTIEIARQSQGKFSEILALDFSEEMIKLARKKIARISGGDRVKILQADVLTLPVTDEDFDQAVVAFGIRNVSDVPRVLRETLRALKPGGSLAILEFSTPSSPLVRSVYNLYFRHLLPRIGTIISGDGEAYRYLNESVEAFPCGEEFATIIRQAGFARVQVSPLTFGLVTLYLAHK